MQWDSEIANRRFEIKYGVGRRSQKEKNESQHVYNFESEFRDFEIVQYYSAY